MKSLAQALPPEPKAGEPPAKSPVKVDLRQLRGKYERHEPISMVTAYDYPSARLGDAAGADMLLVGDSVGMVVLGQDDTTEVGPHVSLQARDSAKQVGRERPPAPPGLEPLAPRSRARS